MEMGHVVPRNPRHDDALHDGRAVPRTEDARDQDDGRVVPRNPRQERWSAGYSRATEHWT